MVHQGPERMYSPFLRSPRHFSPIAGLLAIPPRMFLLLVPLVQLFSLWERKTPTKRSPEYETASRVLRGPCSSPCSSCSFTSLHSAHPSLAPGSLILSVWRHIYSSSHKGESAAARGTSLPVLAGLGRVSSVAEEPHTHSPIGGLSALMTRTRECLSLLHFTCS